MKTGKFPLTIKHGPCQATIYQGQNKGHAVFTVVYYDAVPFRTHPSAPRL